MPTAWTAGRSFGLKDFDPADTGHWKSKEHAEEALQEGIARTAELQDKLYAQDNWALLLIFQAMDAAGKDGAIKHVMSGVNPQGCQVYSFKAPSDLELQHDFCGARLVTCRNAGISGFSTGRITKRCWWCGCIRRFCKSQKMPPSLCRQEYLGGAV